MRRACVSENWIDPGSLKGKALTQWYLRSPADVERQRQEAAARRYQEFFYGGPGNDPDPEFGREVPASGQDIDSGFAAPLPASPKDIDPGFTWVADGPNRFRSVRIATDGQSPDPSSLGSTSYSGPPPPGQSEVIGQYPGVGPPDPERAELRSKQAVFADTTPKIDLQNGWFAAPVLAAPLAVMGLEGAAAWAARAALPEIEQPPLNFVGREAWQRGAQKAA